MIEWDIVDRVIWSAVGILYGIGCILAISVFISHFRSGK